MDNTVLVSWQRAPATEFLMILQNLVPSHASRSALVYILAMTESLA